jgi:hypothetical protein
MHPKVLKAVTVIGLDRLRKHLNVTVFKLLYCLFKGVFRVIVSLLLCHL